jgi:predicted permease
MGLNTVLKESQRGALAGGSRWTSAKMLVAGQIALSMTLLVAAALFVGTLRNLLSIDPGFDRRSVLLMNVDLPQNTTPQQRSETYRSILYSLQSVPGVVSAAHSVLTPISPEGWAQPTQPEGFVASSPRDTVLFFNRVSAGYFRTMRTTVLLGREFTEHDTLNAQKVIMINESAAKAFFGDASPIGRTIAVDRIVGPKQRDVYQIVGVVKDAKYNRLNETQRRIAYLAGEQDAAPGPSLRYSILTNKTADAATASIRSSLLQSNPDVALDFRSLDSQVNESLLQPRLVALLSAFFGALALLLAMIGLYGTTMYSVTRRTGEIGIRMAMGARRRSVIWLMMKDVFALLAAGILLGLATSLTMGRFIESLLYGVEWTAPQPMAVAGLLLAVAAALAAYLPARRAARLDPMAALREE